MKSKPNITFADERARRTYEISERIKDIALHTILPPPHIGCHTIRFDAEHETDGFYAILLSGPAGMYPERTYTVPECTKIILEKLEIPFQVIEP